MNKWASCWHNFEQSWFSFRLKVLSVCCSSLIRLYLGGKNPTCYSVVTHRNTFLSQMFSQSSCSHISLLWLQEGKLFKSEKDWKKGAFSLLIFSNTICFQESVCLHAWTRGCPYMAIKWCVRKSWALKKLLQHLSHMTAFPLYLCIPFSRCSTVLYENHSPEKHLLLQQMWLKANYPACHRGEWEISTTVSFSDTLWNVKGQTGLLCVDTISRWGSDKLSPYYDSVLIKTWNTVCICFSCVSWIKKIF